MPQLARGLEQRVCAEDVGAQERLGVVDRAVDVGLGGEVHDRVDATGAVDRRAHGGRVADAALHEAVARVLGDRQQVLEVAGVGELVVADDLPVGVLGEHAPDEGGADEPGAAAYEKPHPFFTLQS